MEYICLPIFLVIKVNGLQSLIIASNQYEKILFHKHQIPRNKMNEITIWKTTKISLKEIKYDIKIYHGH